MQAAAGMDRGFSGSRVAAALAAILVLAIAVPYTLVSALHERRLAHADAELAAIAAQVGAPIAADVLIGRGATPMFVDEGWTAASSSSLARLGIDPGPDPWGNAYVARARDGAMTILSAGPDGILQTRFESAAAAAADDRAVTVRLPGSR